MTPPLNKAQCSAIANVVANFALMHEANLTEEERSKIETAALSIEQDNIGENEARVAIIAHNCPASGVSGRQRVSAQAAYDRMVLHYGRYVRTVGVLEDMKAAIASWSGEVRSKSGHAQRFDIDERFEFIGIISELVGSLHVNSLCVTGQGGLGKSFSVMQALSKVMDKVIVTKGHTSARALFDQLGAYPDAIHVFDDCDVVLRDREAINVLKSAVDTGNRQVSWNTFGGEAAPFEFRGSCIFISNMKLNEVPQPILSRSLFVDVAMTTAEKIQRIRTILPKIPCKLESLEEREEVLELLIELGDDITDLNIRTYIKAAALRASNHPKWRQIATYQLTTDLDGDR